MNTVITLLIGIVIGAACLLASGARHAPIKWREVLAALPLPTLALAASYGVWSFNMLYLPMWAAVASAASFELVYIGLAVAELRGTQIRRARWISRAAVGVSVIYNTLSGLFHRNPGWLNDLGSWEWGLAVLHGAPLAIVAYCVSELLLHKSGEETLNSATMTEQQMSMADGVTMALARPGTYPEPVHITASDAGASQASTIAIEGNFDAPVVDRACPQCGASLTTGQYGAAKRYGYCKQCKA